MPGPALAALALLLAAPPAPPGCSVFDLSLAEVGSLEEELARSAGLTGAAPEALGLVRRPSGARPLLLCAGEAPRQAPDREPAAEPVLELVPPRSLTSFRGGWAGDRNDGALWAGRGLSASLSTGLRARWRWLTAQLSPLVAWQQNRPFDVPRSSFPGLSPWANPFDRGQIDLPLRMGPDPFVTFDLGDTFLRADLGPFALGFSNENLWWGPGIRNALLMSNSAAGIPHLFAGTSRPVDVWLGWLEAEAMWGQLRPSRWFDGDTGNRRLFEGAVVTFAPAFDRDLTLGMARVWVFPDRNVNRDAYLNPVVPVFLRAFPSQSRNGRENQLFSFLGRWAFPAVQLEVYGEWAHDDFSYTAVGFLMEERHASAWTFGLQKLFAAGRGWVRLQLEATSTFVQPHLPTGHDAIVYTHNFDLHGYTHGGQMIGAGLGPQGEAWTVGLDGFLGAGRLGLSVERILHDEHYYYTVVGPAQTAANNPRTHDLEMVYGLRGAWAWREWDLTWELSASDRHLVHFQKHEGSFDALLRLGWWPGRTEAPALPAPRRSAAGP